MVNTAPGADEALRRLVRLRRRAAADAHATSSTTTAAKAISKVASRVKQSLRDSAGDVFVSTSTTILFSVFTKHWFFSLILTF